MIPVTNPHICVKKPIIIAGGRYWPIARYYPTVTNWQVIHDWMASTWTKKVKGQMPQWN